MAFDFVTYMRNIATHLKDIGHVEGIDKQRHFFRISSLANFDELLQCINTAQFPALIVEDSLTGKWIGPNNEQLMDEQSYSFMIIARPDSDSPADRETLLKEMRAIYFKIVSKCLKDQRADKLPTFPKTGMAYFNSDTLYYQTVGPLADGCWGIMASFTMDTCVAKDIIYDSDDWTS